MSEAEQDIEEGAVDDLEPEQETEQVEAPKGYQTKEQWEERGHDPADYVSEDVWKAKGDWIKQAGKTKREYEREINGLRAEFGQRLSNNDKLHSIALENTIKSLQNNLDDAIDRGDKDDAKAYQGQIDDNRAVANSLKETPAAALQAPKLTEEQIAWSNNNEWIFGKGAKAAYAKSIMGDIRAGTNSEVEAFQLLDVEINKEFPPTNPRRRQARQSEGGSPSGSAPKSGAITMRDLTPEDRSYMREYGSQVAPDGKGGVDEKVFLKMVADSRS